jgi:hypothetical protein
LSETSSTPPAESAVPPPEPASATAAPEPAPALPEFDPNKNLVYDILFDVVDLELVTRLKWDIFSVERRLERALADDAELETKSPGLKRDLMMALELFRADDDVKAYKERFVRSEERLKLAELVKFLELAVKVREPLHEAWSRYLAFDHQRLLDELAAVDVESLARRPASLLGGSRETESRRCKAVIVHTERSARQIFNEVPFRDYSRVIGWYEEKNPLLANLVSEARVLYLHAGLARQSTRIARELRWTAVAIAAFAATTALAAIVAFLRQ